MKQHYAAEATANPIWLAQRKVKMGQWETITVFSSRESGEAWLVCKEHHFGKLNEKCRVYSVPLEDDYMAEAVWLARQKQGIPDND